MGFWSLLTANVISRRDRNREETPFPSQIVPSGLSAAEGPLTLHDVAHLYSDQANPLGDPEETQTWDLAGAGHCNH